MTTERESACLFSPKQHAVMFGLLAGADLQALRTKGGRAAA